MYIAGFCSTLWRPGLPGAFPQSCFPAGHPPDITDPWSYSSTDAGLYISVSLNFVKLLIALISNLSSGSTTNWCIGNSSQFSVITNLLRMCFVPSSSSLMVTFSSTGPSIGPWGTPLMTGFWLDFMPLITTLWFWQFSQFSIHLIVHLHGPYFIQFVYVDVTSDGVIPMRL